MGRREGETERERKFNRERGGDTGRSKIRLKREIQSKRDFEEW